MILTNQFHDIIPGSPIREVYEQSAIDYEKILSIADGSIADARNDIAEKLDKKKGYVVFNPHSFSGVCAVSLDGVTAIVDDIPFSKAFLCDLMENELCEIIPTDGKLKLDVGCFEIVTVKLK